MKISNLKSQIIKHWQELAIILLTLVLFFANLTPGAYLAGWDSLQTELDPALGVKRALFSVWQEYQSFGLTAGMAHAADLPRAIFIWLISPFMPNWMVRFSFHMLMLGIAGLGMLKLLKFSVGSKHPHKLSASESGSALPIAGAVFYMLSFSTIQMMFLPFEPFSVFFAALPWLIWVYLKLLTQTSPLNARHWLLFTIINILAVPAFVAQQLFVVYALVLILLTIGTISPFIHKSFILNPKSSSGNTTALTYLKRSAIAAFLLIVVNLFWLLPQIYFLATNGNVVRESKINQIATEDIYYSNRDRGNLDDFLMQRGFFSDRLNAADQELFATWNTHRENPVVIVLTALTITITLLGILQKSPYRRSFILLYLLVVIALLSNTEPVASVNEFVRSNNFVNQVFRSPFTKFSILHGLVAAYFFFYGLTLIQSLVRHPKKHKHFGTILATLFVVILSAQSLPAFRGEYFSREMKASIPQEYFSLLSYFKDAPRDKRVALLPDYTFWGWFQTNWGYNGSGFLWYGMEQPFVSRTFDVWSFPSESSYWELKTAVEAEDVELFNSVLAKYDINYLILDKSLEPIVSEQKSLQYDALEEMLEKSSVLKLEKTWGNLLLYSVKSDNEQRNFVSLASDAPNIGPAVRMTNDDPAYLKYGTYQTPIRSGQANSETPYNAYFPFLDLMTQTQNSAKNWAIVTGASSFTFVSPLNFPVENYATSASGEATFDLYSSDAAVRYGLPLESSVTDGFARISFPAFRIDAFTPQNAKIDYCLRKTGDLEAEVGANQITITTAKGATGCIEYSDNTLDQRYGYLLEIKNQNILGPRFYMYVLDSTKEQAYVEDRLTQNNQFYILGPHFNEGLGYSFTLQNSSYQNSPSTNTLSGLSVYLLPYTQIRSFELTNTENPPKKAVFSKDFTANKKNYYLYDIDASTTNDQTLILYQAYQPGWKAYSVQNGLEGTFPYLLGKEIKDHVLINNWANGWSLNNQNPTTSDQRLVIVYLPQYLEYFGLALLGITFLGLVLTAYRHRHKNH